MSTTGVLIVEDERIVALHLRQQLQRLGYQVMGVVASGDQALRQARELQPQVILMDIHIEGNMDGIEAAGRIRDELGIPIVYLTAYAEEETLRRARATKPFGYLLKPFSERELHATIQVVLERHAIELALHESEERLSLALDAAEMGSWELDQTTRRLLRAGQADQIFGFSQEIFSGSWDEFLAQVHEADRALVTDMFSQVLADGALYQVEFRRLAPDGSLRWLKVQGKAFPAGEGKRRIIGVVQDNTERRQAEDRLRQAATVFEATHDGIAILDGLMNVVSVNHGLTAMTGAQPEELRGRPLQLLDPAAQNAAFRRDFTVALVKNGQWRGDLVGLRTSGETFPLLAHIAAVRGEHGEITHFVAVFSDMTAIRKAEEELKHLAHYDPLTDLPNRLLAMDRLEHAMERNARGQGRVGLMLVDLDHFKDVNDTLGHSAGDDLLRDMGKRMRSAVRQEDTVARLGGDEFMVIIEQGDELDTFASVAEKIIEAVCPPIIISGKELSVTASVGISLFPDDARLRENLIRAADTALYAAKDTGRNKYAFYTKEMTESAVRYMAVSQDLRRALEQGELALHYQPQVSVADGSLVGVEALLRWQHPHKGLIGAEQIIPVAEKSGLIVAIGEWVLNQACRQAKEWRADGFPPLRMAVNVSPYQIRTARLLQAVERAMHESGISGSQIEIEITESVLQDQQFGVGVLAKLRDMGVSITIDDFGTGYSCMSSLKTLPINRLKIDRTFLQDIPIDQNNAAITEAIILMAHRLGLSVVAEGVETEAQMDFLRSQRCEEAQGFLHARPMPPAAIAQLMQRSTGQSMAGRRA
jgi:diguanylate cyclase (GGDEF)-like protein/PAS domain S-box-containing protein